MCAIFHCLDMTGEAIPLGRHLFVECLGPNFRGASLVFGTACPRDGCFQLSFQCLDLDFQLADLPLQLGRPCDRHVARLQGVSPLRTQGDRFFREGIPLLLQRRAICFQDLTLSSERGLSCDLRMLER
ncbi:hypothetical protein N799_06130 [Lysobacter arseniciresistens ZS79]|uniref:Uncharacterized protein n=1 Tax=Lysobacter arseniciresistens ZS79 TaxID=913325 RepID=A0A0A0F0U9_9GAMM|nr:hypothetical protein N799_06130 [Lysobacter arseniciresistens ZS79]